ncbi:YbbR-like domain-containing protein [Limosilactobacillus pontis]|uniref:CdaR family protein n=1 Tax=Limosilactobacillus pontis TaxID=35787 RepID=A0ABU7SUD7_9LACO
MGRNKGFFSHKWVMRLASLVLAILLFAYVNGSKNGFLRQNTRNNNENSALMSNKSVTLKMPLDITVDNAKYVVSGYPQYVKVRLSGPSALVTTTSNTQNFKVYADLSNLSSGKHRVPIKTSGLNSELRATVEPKNIAVQIQPRRTVNVKVSVRLNDRNLADNYQTGHPHADVDSVQVTGAQNEVRRVNRVVAYVVVPRDAKDNLQRQVTLQALDRNGQTLNVVIWPTTTTVTVPISSKTSDSSSSHSGSDSSTSSSASSDKKRVQTQSSSSSISNSTSSDSESAATSSSQS